MYNEGVEGSASPVHSLWKAPSRAWPVRVSATQSVAISGVEFDSV
jgi:hypothetical protein